MGNISVQHYAYGFPSESGHQNTGYLEKLRDEYHLGMMMHQLGGQTQALVTWVANSQPTIAPSLEVSSVAQPAALMSTATHRGAPTPTVPVQSP